MRKWLSEYRSNRQLPGEATMPELLAHKVHAHEIRREVSAIDLDELSAVEKYVIGLKYSFGRAYLRFDTMDRDDQIVDQLERIKSLTSEGKVWVLDGSIVGLLTMDVTSDAKRAYQKLLSRESKDEVVLQLLGEQSSWVNDRPQQLIVNRDNVPFCPMDSGLEEICRFFKKTQIGNSDITLSVSGWDLTNMESPSDVICMLAHRFDQMKLYVDSKTKHVYFISLL